MYLQQQCQQINTREIEESNTFKCLLCTRHIHIIWILKSNPSLKPNQASLVAQTVSKESACNAGNPGLIPGSERSPGEGHGDPLQYSCLENSMDRGAWRATVHGITDSWTRLTDTHTHTHTHTHGLVSPLIKWVKWGSENKEQPTSYSQTEPASWLKSWAPPSREHLKPHRAIN